MRTPPPEPDRVVSTGAIAAALLIAQQVVGRATRDALFLSHHPATSLPLLMMAASLVSLACALGAARLLAARGPRQVVPALVGLHAGLLLVQFLLAVADPRLASVLAYLQVAATGGALVSGYWSVVNERFDPWTAKRVIGRLGLGASIGGVAGGLLAWSVTGAISVPAMLLVTAALSVAALVALVLFTGHASAMRSPVVAADVASRVSLRGAPYLQQLALLVALGAATEALLDYVLKAQAAASVGRGPELMAFFAVFHGGVGLLALAVQLVVTRPALETLGLAGAVALRPLGVAAASLVGVLDPRLWSAVFGRAAHDVLSNSVFRAGYELLYTPLAEREKRGAKQVVDVACDKLGALAGGGVVFAAVGLLERPERALLVVAGAVSLLLVASTRRLQRGYVATLEKSLRAGSVRLDMGDVVDSTTRLTLAGTREWPGEPPVPRASAATPDIVRADLDPLLEQIADLRSAQAVRVRRALRERDPLDVSLVSHLIPLLARDDLYLDVLRALRRAAAGATGQLVDALLNPRVDAAVRRRLPRVLKAGRTQRVVDGLLLGLEDASLDVRAQCALALAAVTSRASGLRLDAETVFSSARRELERAPQQPPGGTRSVAVRAAVLEHVFVLLSLLLEREPLRIASWALKGEDAALKGTALEYLENVLPVDVRSALLAYVGARPANRRSRRRNELVADLLESGSGLAAARDRIRSRSLRRRG
jgi:AAA family ATP:ADP antiporter